jgi:hypothetical protein
MQKLQQLHVGGLTGSKVWTVGLPKRGDQSVSVLAADFAICVAVTVVQTRLRVSHQAEFLNFHTALRRFGF